MWIKNTGKSDKFAIGLIFVIMLASYMVSGSIESSEKQEDMREQFSLINEPKYDNFNTITVTGRCSCGHHGDYQKHTRTYINHCPMCGCYDTLSRNPKGVEEGELTCLECNADYCYVDGRDKAPRGVYLTRVKEI